MKRLIEEQKQIHHHLVKVEEIAQQNLILNEEVNDAIEEVKTVLRPRSMEFKTPKKSERALSNNKIVTSLECGISAKRTSLKPVYLDERR